PNTTMASIAGTHTAACALRDDGALAAGSSETQWGAGASSSAQVSLKRVVPENPPNMTTRLRRESNTAHAKLRAAGGVPVGAARTHVGIPRTSRTRRPPRLWPPPPAPPMAMSWFPTGSNTATWFVRGAGAAPPMVATCFHDSPETLCPRNHPSDVTPAASAPPKMYIPWSREE